MGTHFTTAVIYKFQKIIPVHNSKIKFFTRLFKKKTFQNLVEIIAGPFCGALK